MLTKVLLIFLATTIFFDALRRKNSLCRPEFYLLLSLYVYGTSGYIGYLFIDSSNYPFLLDYDISIINKAYFYNVIAFFAIYIGGGLYKSKEFAFLSIKKDSLTHLSAIACIFSVLIFFYYFAQHGAFSGEISHAEFLEERADSFISRLIYIMTVSFSVLSIYERWGLSWIIFGFFAAFNYIGGSRRHALLIFIIIFTAKIFRGISFSKKWIVSAFTVLLTISIIVGSTRGGGRNISQVNIDSAILAFTEFVRPFSSLLYYLDNDFTLVWGGTFLDAFKRITPGFLTPYEKPERLGTQFSDVMETTGAFAGRVPGLGFSPIAELILNFPLPIFSITMSFFLFTFTIAHLSRLLEKTEWAALVPAICPSMFSIGRMGFQDQIGYIFYACVFLALLILCAKVVNVAVQSSKPLYATR